MKHIEATDRQQYQMMSTLDDLIAENHVVRIMDMMVDFTVYNNPQVFRKVKYTEAGRPSYDPVVLIKLLLYGFFNRISSSRKLETEAYRNVELIWLLGDLKPDHWTISNFRKENKELIKFLTKKLREFLKDQGYITLKTVVIDGTKVKANANRDMLTIEKIEAKIEGAGKEIEEYLERLSLSDRRDDLVDELEDGTTSEVNQKYLDKIIELENKIEELNKHKDKMEKEGIKYISLVDPDARLMRSRDGKIPAYNVQIAVDAENKLIADSEVVNDQTDLTVLPQMIESIKEELGQVPESIPVDRGYNNPDVIEKIEKQEDGLQIYAPQEITSRDKEEIKFTYDADKDEYTCSANKRLVLKQRNKKKNKSLANMYQGIECEGCPLRSKCTTSKKGRTYYRYVNQVWRDEYKTRMKTKQGRANASLRKTIVEHPFGTIKCMMGKIPLFLRGLKNVATEIDLYTTAYNLKRLYNIEKFDILVAKMVNYNWATA